MAATKLAEKLEQLQTAREEIAGCCCAAGVGYPPTMWLSLPLKVRPVWSYGWGPGCKVLVKTYQILAASGVGGPKLCEGDKQVPEGIYPITALNLESRYHLSPRLGIQTLLILSGRRRSCGVIREVATLSRKHRRLGHNIFL